MLSSPLVLGVRGPGGMECNTPRECKILALKQQALRAEEKAQQEAELTRATRKNPDDREEEEEEMLNLPSRNQKHQKVTT